MFYQCKLPITSCGIILFRTLPPDNTVDPVNPVNPVNTVNTVNTVQYLMIRRKDSFGYIDFLRGKYSLHHLDKIQQLIAEMSNEEQSRLLQHSFSALWTQLWGNSSTNPQHCFEETTSEKKFNQLVQGYRLHGKWVQLKQLVEQSQHQWAETEWEFPKGRRITHEKDLDCALREFEEETGIPSHSISVVENVLPFEEIFVGSNHKAYKHKFFIATLSPSPPPSTSLPSSQQDLSGHPFSQTPPPESRMSTDEGCIDDELDLSLYQKAEVSAMEWKTYEECMSLIRPYHTEKKRMVKNIHDLITTHWVSEDDELH